MFEVSKQLKLKMNKILKKYLLPLMIAYGSSIKIKKKKKKRREKEEELNCEKNNSAFFIVRSYRFKISFLFLHLDEMK